MEEGWVMAQGRQTGSGCVAVVLLLVAIALCVAWIFGAFDRLLYLFQVESAKPAQSEQIERLADSQENLYAYAQLVDADREKYLILLDAFQSREPRAYPETDMGDLARMRDCVLADHPELFYISGVQMQTTSNRGSGLVTGVMVEGQYTFTEEGAAALQPQIEAAADECMAGMPEGADDYGKAKYLYEYLAHTVEYDQGVPVGATSVAGESAGQTIADALVYRQSVCAGYARAYQYLLVRAGVPCAYVTGRAAGENHAWCVAFLDGNWYHIDPTWGDPQFLGSDGTPADSGRVNYDYLCVTDDDIATTHAIDCPYPLPACTSESDNYYVREGLYLTEPDAEWAGSIVERAVANGEPQARFRCADRDIYDQVVAELFAGQGIYRYIPGNSCRYLLGDGLCTVEIVLD